MADGAINTAEKAPTEDEYAQMVFQDGDSLVVNLDNVAEMKFEAIPKGIYPAEVDQCDFQYSKNSGAPMYQMIMKISDGQYAGRKLYYYASFSPKALSGTKTALMRLAPEIFSQPFKPQEIADSGVMLGKPCRIKIDLEEYQGEKRSKISALLPAAPAGEGGQSSGFFGG